MIKNLSHIWLTQVLLIAFSTSFSQDSVSVKASVDRKEILIGEPIQLMLEVKLPLGSQAAWFPLDSIAHFEFIEKGRIDSVTTISDRSFRQHLIITSFDSGRWAIPALPLTLNGKKYFTDSTPVQVNFSKFDPKQDYHDIKDILPVDNPYTNYIAWILSGLTLVSSLLFLYFVSRKKITRIAEQKNSWRISAYEEAMKSLDELKSRRLPETGQLKPYYTGLNDILRLFVSRKLQIATMEKTNEELIMQLKGLNIPNEQFSLLVQALRMSDFVKFAKYRPDEEENHRNFEIIKSSIELLNAIAK
jgi:hypothetical protein